MSSVSVAEIASTLQEADKQDLISAEDTTLHLISKNALISRMQRVKEVFPTNAIHTVAVKSNPLTEVLKEVVRFGFGLEGASYEEVMHARHQQAEHVAWDSPVKTDREIEQFGTQRNLIISCDHIAEAQRMVDADVKGSILLRINPQLQGSAHASMTVGGVRSKFGEPIANRDAILAFLTANPKVSGLHVHSSSQTIEYTELVHAVRTIVDLANEVSASRKESIRIINIGGGFPVDYFGESNFNIADYAQKLRTACPELFDGTYQMITEFGRHYHANGGFSVTKVSHVKHFGEHQVIVAHAGADMFLRECYQLGVWPHRFLLLDQQWNERSTEATQTDIAGPLCFGGDFIQREFPFMKAESGDWLVIRDTGANSVALWSKHCSRSFPKCLMYDGAGIGVIRERDTLERNLSFWNRG